MTISKTLLPIKGHFFLYWGFMASAPPFVMVVARQMGVPLGVQGVVSAVVTAAAVFARPLIAAVADAFPSRRKIIFLFFIGLMIASYNPLGYLPPLQPPPRLSGTLLPPSAGTDTPYFIVHPHHHHHRQRHFQGHSDECLVTSAWDCLASPYSRRENRERETSGVPTFEARFSLTLVAEGRYRRLDEVDSRHEGSKDRSKREKLEEDKEWHEVSENRLRTRKNKLESRNWHKKDEINLEKRGKYLKNYEHEYDEGKIRLKKRDKKPEEKENGPIVRENQQEGAENSLIKTENKLEGENSLRVDGNKLEEDRNTHIKDHNGKVSHKELPEEVNAARRRWDADSNETLVYEVESSSEWRFTGVYNVSVECLGGELGTVGADGALQKGSCDPAVLKEAYFWVYVMCLMFSYIAATTVESISDAICCDSIGDGGHYGRQRVWGVLSYGLFGALSGMLVDWRSGDHNVRDYRPAFLLMTACGGLDLLLSAACLKVPKLELQKKGVWINLRPLLRRVHFLIFLITTFLTGFFDGLDTGFLFVLQEDIAEKGSGETTHINTAQGVTLLVQAVAAIPFMFLGDWFVRKFTAERVISAVLFLYSIRLLSLSTASYFEALWGTVVVEIINGPCFGLGYTAIVVHAAALAPRGLSNTVQSVVGVCYGTLGYAGASFVGGVMYQAVGGQWLYLLTGVAALITWSLHLAHLKLCPPDVKAAEFESVKAVRQEDPEVLQVMVERDVGAYTAIQQKGGGTNAREKNEEMEVVQKEKYKDISKTGKDENTEKGKHEAEHVIKEKETEDTGDKGTLYMHRKAPEKFIEGEKKQDSEEAEADTLLKNDSASTEGEE